MLALLSLEAMDARHLDSNTDVVAAPPRAEGDVAALQRSYAQSIQAAKVDEQLQAGDVADVLEDMATVKVARGGDKTKASAKLARARQAQKAEEVKAERAESDAAAD